MRLADYVVQRLKEIKINRIFMINGRGILYLSDAIAKDDVLIPVSMHNEQAVAYANMACAQLKNDYSACVVSTGCAATNAVTGVMCAWQDNLPCIFISGNNMLEETGRFRNIPIRTFGQQENDIVELVKPITKYSVMIDDPESIGYEIDKALYLAKEGRPGPVWIDIPLDVQNARIEPSQLRRFDEKSGEDVQDEKMNISLWDGVIDKLNNATRPIVLIGSGIVTSGAQNILADICTKNRLPIVYAASAADAMNSVSDNVIGCVSAMGGSRAGNFAIQNADLVLVLGNRLSPMTTSSEYGKFARDAEIIVVDIDEVEHSKNTVRIDTFIKSDVLIFLEYIQNKITFDCKEWLDKCRHWKAIFPICEASYCNQSEVDLYQLAETLNEVLPKRATLITDAGLEEVILPTNIRFKNEQRIIHPYSQGAMGYALAAAVGAYKVREDDSIIVVVGDGSALFNIQELATIKYHNIPAKIFIHNNNGYATIRKRQKDLFRNRTIGNDSGDGIGIPEYSKIANAFDIAYEIIEDNSDLNRKVAEIIAKPGPVICEICGKEDQSYLHSSVARNQEKKIVRRPLEDQSPYLDRDIFLREMIINPIDQ